MPGSAAVPQRAPNGTFWWKQELWRGSDRKRAFFFFFSHCFKRATWALKALCRGEPAAAELQLGELGACLDFLGQSDHKGGFFF